jgi:hypothetical protein
MLTRYPTVSLPVLVAGFAVELEVAKVVSPHLPNIQLKRLESTPYGSAAGTLSPGALFSH